MSTQVSSKVWGKTELIFSHPMVEMHRIEINKNGVCSKHRHQYKHNGFFVESGGPLIIRVWKNDYPLVDETALNIREFCVVKPNEWHQFEAVDRTIAFEIYWVSLDVNDIVRETCGFMKPQLETPAADPLS